MQRDATAQAAQQPGVKRKLLLVDDDAPLRKNLVRAFERENFEVATAGSLKEAYEVAGEFAPDFAVVDLNLQDGYGMELVGALQDLRPGVRVVVLTGYDSIASSLVALKAGAVGYLLKHSAPDDVLRAIQQAQRGETVLHPTIARMVLQELHRPAQPKRARTTDPLSERELEVLRLLAQGLSNQEIADRLVVGEAAVRSHVSSILRKLQLASRTQAALYALREGLATLDEGGTAD